MVETTCQPFLEDHNSCQLERRCRFLLATLVTKSFTFIWLLWRDNFAEHLLTNRSHKPDTPTKFLACYFRRKLFLVSWRISILEVVEIFGNPEIIHYTHPAFQFFQVLDQFEHDGWWLFPHPSGLPKRCTWKHPSSTIERNCCCWSIKPKCGRCYTNTNICVCAS